jgi:DNA-binding beta-propeller fold protein YncE
VGTTAGDIVTVDTLVGKCVASVGIAAALRGLAVTRDGTRVYVLSLDPRVGGLMDVIDTARRAIIATVQVGVAPTQLALSANADRAYVVDGDRILVLCTATHDILDTIDIGAEISCVTESADGTDLYVADFDGGVTVASVAPTAALLARLMRDHGVEPQRLRELEPAGV